MSRKGFWYTEEEKDLFRYLWYNGIKPSEIARLMDRSVDSCYRYADVYSLPTQKEIHRRRATELLKEFRKQRANGENLQELA